MSMYEEVFLSAGRTFDSRIGPPISFFPLNCFQYYSPNLIKGKQLVPRLVRNRIVGSGIRLHTRHVLLEPFEVSPIENLGMAHIHSPIRLDEPISKLHIPSDMG